jgi:hypothetical protein
MQVPRFIRQNTGDIWQRLTGVVSLNNPTRERAETQQQQFLRDLERLMDRYEVDAVEIRRRRDSVAARSTRQMTEAIEAEQDRVHRFELVNLRNRDRWASTVKPWHKG